MVLCTLESFYKKNQVGSKQRVDQSYYKERHVMLHMLFRTTTLFG